MSLDLVPDQLLAILLRAPDAARDTLSEVLAEGAVMATRTDDPGAQVATIAAWCCYQAQQTSSGDLVESWVDELACAAVILAGDVLAETLPSQPLG